MSLCRPGSSAYSRTESTHCTLALRMAFREIVNLGVHAKAARWSAVNFYEIFGVTCNEAKNMGADEFEKAITESWAKRLVDIPTVAANLDVYLKDEPFCWSDNAASKVEFDKLVQAHKVLRARADTGGTSPVASSMATELRSCAVLGVNHDVDPQSLDKAFKASLLRMSDDGYCGRCYEACLISDGERRGAESWCYPIDDFVQFEKLEHGHLVLNSRRYVRRHQRAIYDNELNFDPHPSAQLRATHRAMYHQRLGMEEPEPRLAELQRLLADTATAAEAEDLLDQFRYVFLDQVTDETEEWCRNTAFELKQRLETASSSPKVAAQDCLELLEAEIRNHELCSSVKTRSTSWLDSRRQALHEALASYEVDAMDLAICQEGLCCLAIKKCEVRGDIRRLEVEVTERAGLLPIHTERHRLDKLRERLRTLETNVAKYTMREELRFVHFRLDGEYDPTETIAPVESNARCRLCSGPNNYDPSRFCYTCEFPNCAACGVRRSETAGPRYKGRHVGKITKGEPWYERPTQTQPRDPERDKQIQNLIFYSRASCFTHSSSVAESHQGRVGDWCFCQI